ncbi:MAG: nucleotidyltransferase domain-containing protein [DPANN group archaeon]|nr:nucleotidyltransferase domain-containing protein [DPANN group archaeon]
MSRINYNNEIIGCLLIKPNHIRGLAKDLNTNQTTISRKIQDLYEQNIVDFRFEGKNKVFFLKKTLEACESVLIVERHKLIDILQLYPHLRRIIEIIKSDRRINMAVIFGSYAKHSATKTSDIDLYVDTEDRILKEILSDIDSKLSIKIGKYDKANLLIKEIEKDHIIIKGVDEFYEKNKFFE